MRMKYFSMFSGVGGFELGIGNKGECVGFSENDKYASELLKKKFPNIKNYGDATKINPNELPDFDLLCGGFPCQAFSIAGKRRGFQDTRGTLFFEIARIVEAKRPKIILLENVKGLLNHEKGKTFSLILQTLSELGYGIQWMVLNSKFFGVPQNRERVFIIGSLRETSKSQILPLRESDRNINERNNPGIPTSQTLRAGYYKGGQGTHIKMIQIQKIRDGGQGNRIYSSEGVSTTIQGQAGGQGAKTGLYAVLTPDRENKRQNGRRFKEDGEPSFTITVQDVHGVMEVAKAIDANYPKGNSPSHRKQNRMIITEIRQRGSIRRLTPVECERLQGFPDGWTEGFSDTQRYKMMGNAVTVNVVRAIAEVFL